MRVIWCCLWVTTQITRQQEVEPQLDTEATATENRRLLRQLPGEAVTLANKLKEVTPYQQANWQVGNMIVYRLFEKQTLEEGIAECKFRQSQLIMIDQVADITLPGDETTYHVTEAPPGLFIIQGRAETKEWIAKHTCRVFTIATSQVLTVKTSECTQRHTTICARRTHTLDTSPAQIRTTETAINLIKKTVNHQINTVIDVINKLAALLADDPKFTTAIIRQTELSAPLQQAVAAIKEGHEVFPSQPLLRDVTQAMVTLTTSLNTVAFQEIGYHIQRLYSIAIGTARDQARSPPPQPTAQEGSGDAQEAAENKQTENQDWRPELKLLDEKVSRVIEIENYLTLMPSLTTLPSEVEALRSAFARHERKAQGEPEMQGKQREGKVLEPEKLENPTTVPGMRPETTSAQPPKTSPKPSPPTPSNTTGAKTALEWLLTETKGLTAVIDDLGDCSGCTQQYALVIIANIIVTVTIIIPLTALYLRATSRISQTRRYLQLKTDEPVLESLKERITKVEVQQMKTSSKIQGIRQDLEPLLQ